MNTKRNTFIGIAFGIVAALAYGLSSVLIKQSLADLAPPLVGAAVALLSGTLVLLVIGARDLRTNLAQNRKGVGCLLLAGISASLGVVSS